MADTDPPPPDLGPRMADEIVARIEALIAADHPEEPQEQEP